MEQEYNVALLERPLDDGLSKEEFEYLFKRLSGKKAIPIEFQGEFSTAMGLINLTDAEMMNYDYSGLEAMVTGILNDTGKERADCSYIYHTDACDHSVWLSRAM